MDRGHELDYVKHMIKKKLKPYGIAVNITIYDEGTVTLSAKKQIGINIQHAYICSDSLTEAIIKLIKYIEDNITQWTEEEVY